MSLLDTTAEVMNLTLGDQVIVRNVGDTDLVWQWAGRKHLLRVGRDTQVSFDLMKKECGDPRSAERSAAIKDEFNGLMTIPSRADEVKRLLQLHASSVPSFKEYIPGDRTAFPEGEPLTDTCPQVEVYTLDMQRIWTVLDDPYGDRISPAAPTRSEAYLNQQAMSDMQRELAESRRLIELLSKKLNMNPEDLGEPLPLAARVSGEAPVDGTTGEVGDPRMLLNPRTNKVSRARPKVADPTSLDELPEDD